MIKLQLTIIIYCHIQQANFQIRLDFSLLLIVKLFLYLFLAIVASFSIHFLLPFRVSKNYCHNSYVTKE